MGKYMRKSKLAGEVAVVDLSHHQAPLGVRTRARTLALQSRHASPDPDCYLHLRSRKLEKHPPPKEGRTDPSADVDEFASKARGFQRGRETQDMGHEASFGDSVPEADATERDARETTPCSFIYDSGKVTTPSSTSQPSRRKIEIAACRNTPTDEEIEEFFANAEQHQHSFFVEKYNFDALNECPLPGRYEWVRLESY